jgi:hypothetical protein
VAYYPFNGNAKDESGNGHVGEVKGATLSKDRHNADGKAYSFDGINDYISVPDHNDLDLGTGAVKEMTISLWIKHNGNNGMLISKISNQSSTYVDYAIHMDTSIPREGLIWGTGRSAAGGGDDVNAWMMTGTTPPADVWHHVLVTYQNSGGGTKRVYLNGQLIKQASIGSQNAANNSPLRIGSEFNRNYWNGKIDDVRIYNRALSEEEVKALYEFEKPKTQQASTTTWTSDPSNPQNVIVEKAIRESLNKPTGELTKADLESLTSIHFFQIQITDGGLKEVAKLTQLTKDLPYSNAT